MRLVGGGGTDFRPAFSYVRDLLDKGELKNMSDRWDDSKIQPGGRKVESGFEYSSGKNTEWLSIEDIAKRLENVKEH